MTGRGLPPAATGAWRRFVLRWGWRAYALPVLTVVTVVAVVVLSGVGTGRATPGAGGAPLSRASAATATSAATSTTAGTSTSATAAAASAPATAGGDRALSTDSGGSAAGTAALPSDALPDGAPYTVAGAGTFHTVPGSSPVVGTGPLHRYTVDVEDGITGVDEAGFARFVAATLSDPRSWVGRAGSGRLQRVDSGAVSWRVTLTSAMTVRRLCGYEQAIETSCWDPGSDRVVLNVARWVRGDVAYVGDLTAYRTYMVNHEDGHALGHQHVTSCLADGHAPVMMQQTITLRAADGTMCQAEPWPYPPGVDPGPDPTGVAAPAVG